MSSVTEGLLGAPVKDGILQQMQREDTDNKSKEKNNELGKDAFLQLLVAQMKYQDPLNPSTDTQFVSQLATFSQLEQMQNLNASFTNNQAFTLLGKTVTIKTESTTGTYTEVEGVVDAVTVKKGEAYLTIDGKSYAMSDLEAVASDSYVYKQKAPSVEKADWQFDHGNQKDVSVKVSLGKDEAAAGSIAVTVNGNLIDKSYLSYDNEILTVNHLAFQSLSAGKYDITISFDDANYTTVTDKVTLTVVGTPNIADNDTDNGSDDSTDSSDETTDTETPIEE